MHTFYTLCMFKQTYYMLCMNSYMQEKSLSEANIIHKTRWTNEVWIVLNSNGDQSDKRVIVILWVSDIKKNDLLLFTCNMNLSQKNCYQSITLNYSLMF